MCESYLFKSEPELLHDVHDDARCRPRDTHGTVHQHHILIVANPVEGVNSLVYLVGSDFFLLEGLLGSVGVEVNV
jgi:hypothetical protein